MGFSGVFRSIPSRNNGTTRGPQSSPRFRWFILLENIYLVRLEVKAVPSAPMQTLNKLVVHALHWVWARCQHVISFYGGLLVHTRVPPATVFLLPSHVCLDISALHLCLTSPYVTIWYNRRGLYHGNHRKCSLRLDSFTALNTLPRTDYLVTWV